MQLGWQRSSSWRRLLGTVWMTEVRIQRLRLFHSSQLKEIHLTLFHIYPIFSGQTRGRGSAPPYGFSFSQEATSEDIRWRRLRRFDSWTFRRKEKGGFGWSWNRLRRLHWIKRFYVSFSPYGKLQHLIFFVLACSWLWALSMPPKQADCVYVCVVTKQNDAQLLSVDFRRSFGVKCRQTGKFLYCRCFYDPF